MAYSLAVNIPLGDGQTGLTLTAALFDADGTPFAGAGFATTSSGEIANGHYRWYGTLPDGHEGFLTFADGDGFTHASLSINPVETELSAAVAALLAGAIPEPAGVFDWGSATLAEIIAWLGALGSNEIRETIDTQTLRNRADDATIATADVDDDGATTTRGSFT